VETNKHKAAMDFAIHSMLLTPTELAAPSGRLDATTFVMVLWVGTVGAIKIVSPTTTELAVQAGIKDVMDFAIAEP